jgi:protein-S-isoprenylcysteine O-methyltransferase Ste14
MAMSTHAVDPKDHVSNQTRQSKGKLLIRVGIYIVVMTVIVMLLAGRWDWWMAWAYFVVYGIIVIVGVLVVPLDQQLIDERTQMKEDVKRWDKVLTGLLSPIYPFGMFILAALEMRFGQALQYPLWLQIIGLIALVLGQLLGTWAMASNRFYARFVRIQSDRGHVVVNKGPYRFVRHPGYVGAIIGAFGTAIAIGSLWALVLAGFISVMLIIRTALEDRVLKDELAGYIAYADDTRYRLLPGIW